MEETQSMEDPLPWDSVEMAPWLQVPRGGLTELLFLLCALSWAIRCLMCTVLYVPWMSVPCPMCCLQTLAFPQLSPTLVTVSASYNPICWFSGLFPGVLECNSENHLHPLLGLDGAGGSGGHWDRSLGIKEFIWRVVNAMCRQVKGQQHVRGSTENPGPRSSDRRHGRVSEENQSPRGRQG